MNLDDGLVEKLKERAKVFSKDNFKTETQVLRDWYDLLIESAMMIGASVALENNERICSHRRD